MNWKPLLYVSDWMIAKGPKRLVVGTFRISVLTLILILGVNAGIASTVSAAESVKGISVASKAVRDKVDMKLPEGCGHIYGFNYQPSWGNNGLTVWGEKFDANKYREELTLGKKYFPKFNTVRIWLSLSAYRAAPEDFVRKFQQAVNICGELDLLVIPVIFNRWTGDPLWELQGDIEIAADFDVTFAPFIRDLVLPLRGDQRILAWDLCNEPKGFTEMQWLSKTRDCVKKCDPAALTCIGVVPKINHLEYYANLQDILTPHLYCPRPNGINVAAYFELAQKLGKPIMSTECCWGSLDDAARVRTIRSNLEMLTKYKIGFFPHALYESGGRFAPFAVWPG